MSDYQSIKSTFLLTEAVRVMPDRGTVFVSRLYSILSVMSPSDEMRRRGAWNAAARIIDTCGKCKQQVVRGCPPEDESEALRRVDVGHSGLLV